MLLSLIWSLYYASPSSRELMLLECCNLCTEKLSASDSSHMPHVSQLKYSVQTVTSNGIEINTVNYLICV